MSSSTPRVSGTAVPPANGANSMSASAPPGAQTSQEISGVLVPEVRATLEDMSGVPAYQQISDSICVGDAAEASLDDLL